MHIIHVCRWHSIVALKSAEDIDQVEHAINADLKKVDEWYEFNQMKRNHSKYQAITFGRVERNPVLTCEGTVIPIQDEMELLGITLDNKLISLRDRFVKSVIKLVNRLLFSMVWRKYCLLNRGYIYISCFHCTAFQLLLRVVATLW